jgi:hypothetical protein
MTTDREFAMYGMAEETIRTEYIESFTGRECGMEMVVAGILSDCQELLSMDPERAAERIRKQLNVAKFILFNMQDTV